MNISMFFWRNQNKIFQAVILGVAVFMVNMYAFWSRRKDAVLIFPLVWIGNFYSYVHTTIACFMQPLASNRQLNADLVYHFFLGGLNLIGHCFVCASRTTRSVVIGIAVNTFPPDNGGIAKWARFGKKSFHASNIYQA